MVVAGPKKASLHPFIPAWRRLRGILPVCVCGVNVFRLAISDKRKCNHENTKTRRTPIRDVAAGPNRFRQGYGGQDEPALQ